MSFLVSRTSTAPETNLPTRLMTAITETKMARLLLSFQKTLRKTISKMMARTLTIPVTTIGSIIPGWARLQIRQKWNKMLMKRNP